MHLQPDVNYKSDDVVYTPHSLAKRIIHHFNPMGRVLDPCAGNGSFYEQIGLPEGFDYMGEEDANGISWVKGKEWCEISKGRDFFDWNRKVDWIISNPPYSIFRKFLLHSMEIADNIVYLITVNHVWTRARIRDIRENGFGIREIFCVNTPSNFPPSGFQYGAVHFQRGFQGPIALTFDDSTTQSTFSQIQ